MEIHPTLVVLESPFSGDIERNTAYARAAMADCLRRGEYPLASHLLYTQPGILNDDDPNERKTGIEAGLAWGAFASKTVAYVDYGITKGMALGIDAAVAVGRRLEYRTLDGWEDGVPGGTNRRDRLIAAIEGECSGFYVNEKTADAILDYVDLGHVASGEVPARAFKLGDRVTKLRGSSWTGRVVGFYGTALTKVGYAIESENEPGSVQIYPESALTKMEWPA